MKQAAKKTGIIFAAVLLFSLLSSALSHAQENTSEDKTLSPYFFVRSDAPGHDQMPLKSTAADVTIVGVIADVKVTQVYRNEGKRALEAVYVFPASTRAAVYGMRMTIGKRIVEAKIKRRDEAQQEYEEAKKQGRSASLLEQKRPNVFQMNVANIMAGDTITVELRYTELMVPEDRTYEFVYPTVVGPRYSNQPSAAAATPNSVPNLVPASITKKWVENPHLHQGEAPTYTFDIRVNINAGLPVHQISCGSHKVTISYDGPSYAVVGLDRSEARGGNRDYILKYQLAGDRIESGLLLLDNGKEKFFLLQLQPPKRFLPAEMPGREYIFIVDVSGSMHGFPLDISKRLFKDLLSNLRATDRFNVLLFSGGSAVLSEQSMTATPENIRKATSFIDQQQGGGGTELLPALKRALSLPQAEGFSRTVVIATDGYVTVEEEVFDLIRKNLNRANMFTFGIGTSTNRHILEGMARVGNGEPFVITKAEEAPARAAAFRNMIQSPLLSHIAIHYVGFDAYDIEPVTVPDVLADRPVIVFGKWRGKPAGKIIVKGVSGNGIFKQVINVDKVSPSKSNSALRYLWARQRIALLSDYNRLRSDDKRIQEVTRLGLQYNLLTAYTSFIAADSEVRNKNEEQTTVRQPLPMPEGVSDYALPGSAPFAAPSYPAARKSALQAAGEIISGLQSNRSDQAAQQDALATVRQEEKAKEAVARQIAVTGIRSERVISSDALRTIVQSHRQELEACLGGNGTTGSLLLEVSLNKKGMASAVRIISNSLNNRETAQCIRAAVVKWQFSAAGVARGPRGTFRFTLVF
ncbi:MAG: VIT domain-containing protein [Thermodesulfovibrionales bacterium]